MSGATSAAAKDGEKERKSAHVCVYVSVYPHRLTAHRAKKEKFIIISIRNFCAQASYST